MQLETSNKYVFTLFCACSVEPSDDIDGRATWVELRYKRDRPTVLVFLDSRTPSDVIKRLPIVKKHNTS